jgi:ubiquinone/menaquinone biosynthesis C-methylase UbiE
LLVLWKEAVLPESRQYNPEYYDAFEWPLDDVRFYGRYIDDNCEVLELGCGTGRVSIPLAKKAKHVTGVELSDTMLNQAKKKCLLSNIDFILGDITSINLSKKFDLVIAPFRVLQCLEKPKQIAGFFHVIRKHLDANGIAIVNAFNPKFTKEEMADKWMSIDETFCEETQLSNGDTLKLWDTRKHLDIEDQVLHPEMIYRRYRNDVLVDTHINPLCMKYWYPEQFKELIENEDFRIVQLWGGYLEEDFGQGPELVIAFQHKNA